MPGEQILFGKMLSIASNIAPKSGRISRVKTLVVLGVRTTSFRQTVPDAPIFWSDGQNARVHAQARDLLGLLL
jgi:hypothetical protein